MSIFIRTIANGALALLLLLLSIAVPLVVLMEYAGTVFREGRAAVVLTIALLIASATALIAAAAWNAARGKGRRSLASSFGFVILLFIFPMLLFTTVLWFAESRLRSLGNEPGMLEFGGFQITDDVEVMPYYISDSTGLIRLDPACDEWKERGYVINSQGFRSGLEYRRDVMDSIKREGEYIVAIIGDSHTEGCWSSTMDLSYPDLVDDVEGVTVLNFGVGGTDPVQYRLVAEQYLPKLMPDHVIVSVCGHTDFMSFMRRPSPGIPIYYTTSAGWFDSQLPLYMGGEPNKLFASADDAYDHYLDQFTMYGKDAGYLQTSMRKLVLTTKLWDRFLNTDKLPEHSEPFPEETGQATFDCLTRIRSIADSLGVTCTIAAIPPEPMVEAGSPIPEIHEELENIFRGVEYVMPENIVLGDYAIDTISGSQDIHFNDYGHRKFADFLIAEIRAARE